MSFNKFILPLYFSAALFAQLPVGVGSGLSGEIRSNGPTSLNTLFVELYDPRNHVVVERISISSDGSFLAQSWERRAFLHSARGKRSGRTPLVEESRRLGLDHSLVLKLPEQTTSQPPAGRVSIHELQHQIPKQAIRAAVEAQRYSESHDTAKAIAKLEQAIRIAPSFRTAHANLGVQYARVRFEDAMGQFRVALGIGPPDVLVYSNLSLVLLTLKQYREGEEFARKALALDPENTTVQMMLRFAEAHSRELGWSAIGKRIETPYFDGGTGSTFMPSWTVSLGLAITRSPGCRPLMISSLSP